MNRTSLLLPLAAAPLLGSCISFKASSDAPLHAPALGAEVEASTEVVAAPAPAAPAAPAAAPRPAEASRPTEGRESEWSDEELAIWRSPAFRHDFLQSFKSETDVEPRLTAQEIEDISAVLDLIGEDRTDEAVTLIEENRATGCAVWDQTLGNIYFQREEWDQAAWAYESAVEKYPKFRRAWKNLGVVQVRRGEFSPAIEAFSKVISLGGADAIMYGLLGYAYSKVGNQINAESAYRMAHLMAPETNDWKMGLIRSLFKQRRYADAAALCDAMIAENPGKAQLWLLQANAYLGLGEPTKAAQNFEFVDSLGESTNDSLNVLGDIYVNEATYDQAASAYRRSLLGAGPKGIDKAIRNAKVLVSRNASQDAQGLVDELEDLYLQEFSAEQRKELLRLNARLAVNRGATDEQVAALVELVELDPLDGGSLISLGDHHANQGEIEVAGNYYARAAQINETFEAKATRLHGQMLAREKRYQEALRLLRRSLQLKENERLRVYVEEIEKLAR